MFSASSLTAPIASMLIGTFCRFSSRFCADTVTVPSVAAFLLVAGALVVSVACSGSSATAASCAKAAELIAKQMAAANGSFLRVDG